VNVCIYVYVHVCVYVYVCVCVCVLACPGMCVCVWYLPGPMEEGGRVRREEEEGKFIPN